MRKVKKRILYCRSILFIIILSGITLAISCKFTPSSSHMERLFRRPANFAAKYKVIRTKPMHYSNVKRYTMTITVPTGLSEDDLKNTLRAAMEKIYKKTQADAISIHAYRADLPVEGSYNAAEVTLAPGGDWGQAKANTPVRNLRLKFIISKGYYEKVSTFPIGKQVTLKECTLSKSPKSWMRDDEIAEIKKGTKAKIVEKRLYPLGDSTMIRYKVKIGKKQGWIHSHYIME